MAKRKRYDSETSAYDAQDNPIGLTEAFEVVRDPQAVEYDSDDQSIGLTEAFGAVSGEEDEAHSWDKAGKWTDFDWDSVGQVDESGTLIEPSAAEEDEGMAADAAADGSADEPETQGDADAQAAAQPDADVQGAAQDDAGARPEAPGQDDAAVQIGAPASANAAAPAVPSEQRKARGGHGRHAAPVPELSPRMKKSKRTRRVLIVFVVLLVLLAGALGYFIYKTFTESQQEAAHQAEEQVAAAGDQHMDEKSGDDAVETAVRAADVPELAGLLGKTADDAVAAIGRGALVTQNNKVKEKGSAIKTSMNVALTEEPADSKTGTPTVYLGLNKNGKIVQVGYSAAASALGFGSLSFADAVSGEHVVEKTLAKIGVEVPEGSAALPDDKKKYSTYASDGTTVLKERCSFSGDVEVDGKSCEWSAVLSYDYTTQVVTGDLSDTVRVIYVYLTQK